MKDVLRDLPASDATFEKKLDYIRKVMNELAKHQGKGKGTNWYGLGKALMNPNPFSAVESFFGALGTVADNIVGEFKDINHRRKTKKDLEERLGMNVPKEIKAKTKKLAESDAFGHGDVSNTLGSTRHWTKGQHEAFHNDHESLLSSFEEEKAAGTSSPGALNHKYAHLSDVVMRKHRALANAENGAYRSKTVPTMDDLNTLDLSIFSGVDGTSYVDPGKFNNLVKESRKWSREAQTEFASMLDQVRKASPEDKEEMLSTAVAKAGMLDKLDEMARGKFNSVSKPEDKAPKRSNYSGPWKSDTYNELQSVIKEADGIQGALDKFKTTGEKWDARLNLHAEKLIQQLRKDLDLEDHFSVAGGLETAAAPADTSWAESLPDTKAADSYKFENVKPEQNVGRGYKDPDGVEYSVVRYHAPSGTYTVNRINPAYNPKLGEIDGTNEKFISESMSAKELHRAVNSGMYTGTAIRWAHDPNESGRDRAFAASLKDVGGGVEHPDAESLSKRERIDHKLPGYGHYHKGPSADQEHSKKADFGSTRFRTNPKHNEGQGYMDPNGVTHFIEEYHPPSGDKEDYYTVKHVDFDGKDKTEEVDVEELSQSFLSGGGYKGHAATWHPGHEKSSSVRNAERDKQERKQEVLQGKKEDSTGISEAAETFDPEKHLDLHGQRAYTSIEDDLPHSTKLSEIFTGYKASEDSDFKIPLAYDITDEDTMRKTWGHWLSNANLKKKKHDDFVGAQDAFTKVKQWALENYEKDIASDVPQDKAVKKLRGRLVFANGGYRDFATILRDVKASAVTDVSEDKKKVGPFNLPDNSEFKDLHKDAAAVLGTAEQKDIGFPSKPTYGATEARKRIDTRDVGPSEKRKAARGEKDVPATPEAAEVKEAPTAAAEEKVSSDDTTPDDQVVAPEAGAAPEDVGEEAVTGEVEPPAKQKGEFTPEEAAPPEAVPKEQRHLREHVVARGETPRENVAFVKANPPGHDKGSRVYGGSTGEKSIPVEYGLVSLSSLLPSHRVQTGSEGLVPNTDQGYPVGQERADQYETPEAKAKLKRRAGATQRDKDGAVIGGFRSSALLSTGESPNEGPPTVSKDALGLGGNSRIIILQELQSNGRLGEYQDDLKARAEELGINPESVSGDMVYVRMVDKNHHDMNAEELMGYSSDLNAQVSAGKTQMTKATRVAEFLKDNEGMFYDRESGAGLNIGSHGNIRDFLESKEGKSLVETAKGTNVGKGVSSGLGEHDELFEGEELTVHGKNTFEQALGMLAAGGGSSYRSAPRRVQERLGDVGMWVKYAAIEDKDMDLVPAISQAIDAHATVTKYGKDTTKEGSKQEAAFKKLSSDDKLTKIFGGGPEDMFSGESTKGHPIENDSLGRLMYDVMFGKDEDTHANSYRHSANNIRNIFKEYATHLASTKQADMVGEKRGASPEEALRAAYEKVMGTPAPGVVQSETPTKEAEVVAPEAAPEPQAEKPAKGDAKTESKDLHGALSKQGYAAQDIPEDERSEKTRGMKSIVDKDGNEVFRGRANDVWEWLKNTPDTEEPEPAAEGVESPEKAPADGEHGTWTDTDEDGYPAGTFTGTAKGGKLEGPGTHVTVAGRRNTGTFKAGKLDGEGESSYPGGAIYRGTFKAGSPHGDMSIEYPDGSSLTGVFENGQQHGKSTRTLPDGTTISGTYEKGKPVGKFTRAFSDSVVKEREQEAVKALPDKTLKALYKDKAAKSDLTLWHKINEKHGDDISRLEVLAFNDKDHYDSARESGETSDNSIHGGYKTWDEVKDSIKPGMFLEFKPSVDTDALSDKLRADNLSEKEIDKELAKVSSIEDGTERTVVVPKPTKVQAKEKGYFSDDSFSKESPNKVTALKDEGLEDWTFHAAGGGRLSVKSPDGTITIATSEDSGRPSGKGWEVLSGANYVSSHLDFRGAVKSAKEEHETEWEADDAPEAVSVEDVTHDDTPLTKAEQAEVDELEKMLGGDSAGVADLIQELNDGC